MGNPQLTSGRYDWYLPFYFPHNASEVLMKCCSVLEINATLKSQRHCESIKIVGDSSCQLNQGGWVVTKVAITAAAAVPNWHSQC